MALHLVGSEESESIYDVYAQDVSVESIPKFKMGKNALDPDLVTNLILDGNAKQNLATFCQTDVDEHIHKIMDKCIDKNMIDKDEYPQTAEIENRCVHILADLPTSLIS